MDLEVKVPSNLQKSVTGYRGSIIRKNRKTVHEVSFHAVAKEVNDEWVNVGTRIAYKKNGKTEPLDNLPLTVSDAMRTLAINLKWL